MATNFAPQLGIKYDAGVETRLFKVDSAATFIAGALVYWDTATQTLKECGADPSLILGVAQAPASMGLATTGSIWGASKIPVAVLSPTAVAFMGSSSTPAVTDILVAYGIVKSTNWLVDTSDTSNTRVDVIEIAVSPQPEGYYVRFKAANLQGDAIAS